MTQLEINLDTGLPTLVPTKDGESGRYFKLALSKDIASSNVSAKCEMIEASMMSLTDMRSNLIISFDIRKEADEKFNVLENLMTRGTESWDGDERFEEYRKHLAAGMKLAIANGMATLPEGYTMADVEKAKGVRWAQKAGCSCPCSPGYSTPLIPTKSYFRPATRRNGRGRWSSNEAVNWVNIVLVLKPDATVVSRVRMQQEQVEAALEVRKVNKVAIRQVDALIKG